MLKVSFSVLISRNLSKSQILSETVRFGNMARKWMWEYHTGHNRFSFQEWNNYLKMTSKYLHNFIEFFKNIVLF